MTDQRLICGACASGSHDDCAVVVGPDRDRMCPCAIRQPQLPAHQAAIAALVVAPARDAELEQLRRWKAEALPVMAGLQEVGRALGLRPGMQITGRAAVDAALDLRNERDAARAQLDGLDRRVQWGVRFPSGAVDAQPDEASARRFSLACNRARPDLPTLVARCVVTGWEVLE